jgi:hypothetical protein
MAVCQEWDKQDFNFQTQIFGKDVSSNIALGKYKEELIYQEKSRKKYRASLLSIFNVSMNFVSEHTLHMSLLSLM